MKQTTQPNKPQNPQSKQNNPAPTIDMEALKKDIMADLKADMKAEIRKEVYDEVKKEVLEEVTNEVTANFTKEETQKTKNDGIKRDVKIKALRPILVNGHVYEENKELLVSEEEAEMFCKPIKGPYNGYGEGHYDRVKVVRAERVA